MACAPCPCTGTLSGAPAAAPAGPGHTEAAPGLRWAQNRPRRSLGHRAGLAQSGSGLRARPSPPRRGSGSPSERSSPRGTAAGGRLLLTERLYESTSQTARPGLPRKPRRRREALQDPSRISPRAYLGQSWRGECFKRLLFQKLLVALVVTGFCCIPLLHPPWLPSSSHF